MKVYTSTPIANRDELKIFTDAIERLQKSGTKVFEIFSEIELPIPKDVNYHIKKYKEAEKALKRADIVILEVSYPGRRIGYEMARALDEGKVVILLYLKDAQVMPSNIYGNQSKKLIVKEYTEDTIDDTIEEALKAAKKLLDTKFILIISPEIDRYLNWSAGKKRMHKAQIVRSAIEATMAKDAEYKKHLKDE